MKKSVAALCCSVIALVASCGSDSPSSGSDAPSQPTATTSTAAPVPTSSAPSTTTVATTTPSTTPQTEATTPATEATDPPTTDSAPETTPATDPPPTSAASNEYVPVASPAVPAQTQPVTADDTHPDGIYYASISEGGDLGPAEGSVVFELVQLFNGQNCVDHFGDDDEDACVNDYGIETEPTSYIEVPLDGLFISVADAATQQSYQISGDELGELLLGGDPSAGAPADYLYVGFGYLLTYAGGEVTRVEQWWTP